MSFRLDDLLGEPLLLMELVTAFGIGATTPFLGTKVDTYADEAANVERATVTPHRKERGFIMVTLT